MAGETLLPYHEHKRGKEDFAVVLGTQGWQGRPHYHARNTREVEETLLFYQEYKDDKGDLTAMPGTQES